MTQKFQFHAKLTPTYSGCDSHVFHQLLPFLAPKKPQRPRCLHSGRGLRLWRRGDRLGDLGDSVAEWIRCLNHSNYTGHIL